MENTSIAYTPQFTPKIKSYFFVLGLILCFVTVIGWFVLPFWVLGLGQYFVKRHYNALSCELTPKVLQFKKGIISRVEKSIPLENIQDVTFRQGLLMRLLGLSAMEIETAGGQGGGMGGDLTLIGIVNPKEFRKQVLYNREQLLVSRNTGLKTGSSSDNDLLKEIASTLKRIEEKLDKS